MRLLYVTDDVPNRDPLHGDGSSMITFEVLRALDPTIVVTLLTYDSGVPLPPEVRRRCDQVVLLPLPSPPAVLVRTVLGRHDFSGAARSSWSARRTVARLSASHDVTLVHGPQMTAVAGAVEGPLVLQAVDPWSLAVLAGLPGHRGLRRVFRRHKGRQSLAGERGLPRRARLLTVGAEDARVWSERLGHPVRSIPNGADVVPRPPRPPGPPVVCSVGTLDYAPNVASAQILVREIAPLLWRTHPDAQIVLAGRRPVPQVLELAGERVEVRGNVPSVVDVFHGADVAAFPDDAGLGVRNSVTEALAAGIPVVATAVAAREQPPHPLLHVVDGTAAFADRVRAVLDLAAGPAPAPTTAAIRTWREATAEYEAELYRAAADTGPPRR